MKSAIRAGLIGAGVGAGIMFLLDPDRGGRRRALVRDKAAWMARKTRDAAGATRRDVENRLVGARARARALLSEEALDDVKLQKRVRAALGRVTSHPRAIDVEATGGTVRLTGDALTSEIPSILSAVNRVRGVEAVENDLRPHAEAGNIPWLQGSSDRLASWRGWIRGGWSPTAMLAAGAATGAAAIAVASLARRSAPSADEDRAPGIDIVAIEALPSEALCEDVIVTELPSP